MLRLFKRQPFFYPMLRLTLVSSRSLPTSNHRPPASSHQLPAASFQSPASSRQLPAALLCALFAFALYLRTLAPGLLGGDSGEFQMAAWLAGFVHPTGYPLYLILGYLWTHLLPLHDPAWRMNAFSALWGGAAVGLVYLLATRVLVFPEPRNDTRGDIFRPGGWEVRSLAFFAALTFAVTPTFWSQAVIAEVYTLHAAFVAAVLLGLVAWSQSRNSRILYVTAAVYGLSLTHHRTMLLLVPAMAVFVWLTWRAGKQETSGKARLSTPPRGRVYLLVSLCLLLPLFLYAYIPLRAPRTPYANVRVGPDQALALYEPTFQSFLAYVVGQTFQGEIGTPAQAVARLGSTGRLLINEVSWVGVLLGIIGLGWLAWRSPRLLALTGLSFLAVVAFNLLYGIGDIFVFYIPAYLIWTLWMAAGVAGMRGNGQVGTWQMANRKWQRLQSAICNLQSVIRLLAFLLSIWLLVANFGHLDQSRNNQARAAWQALLAQPIPQAAILVTNDRDEMMSLWYLQYGEGVRPDLTGLFPLIRPEPEWADVAGVTAEALRSGRPVFLIKPMPGLAIKFSMEPAGALTRVRESATVNPPQQPADVIYADAIRLTGYDLRSATLVPGGSVSLTLYWQPLRRLDADYTTFVHLFNADGTRIAQSDHRPGDVYYPTSLWKPAETLADTHTLALPAEPGKPPYTILVGLYTGTTDLRHLGQPQVIGAVKP